MSRPTDRFCRTAVVVAALALLPAGRTTAETTAPQSTVSPCIELPHGELTDADLKRLVPDDAPGRVFIRWRTESQEDNYGFNILRATVADGDYRKINPAIIPGEGSTNIPKDYCFMDVGLPRGSVFFYYIESVSNSGVREVVEGTKNTRVKVKTVAEEREWLRKKARGENTSPPKPAEPVKAQPASQTPDRGSIVLPPRPESAGRGQAKTPDKPNPLE